MAIVLIQMPTVKSAPAVRPKQCPYCGSELLQRWGTVCKPLRDTDLEVAQVQAYRFRCTECGRTFRWYPEGVDKADMSQRLRGLAAMAWRMGLSLRGVGTIFSVFGAPVSRMSVWRVVQEGAKQRKAQIQTQIQAQHSRPEHKVRVLGVDGAWVRLNGKTVGVMVAVDTGDGHLLKMEVVDEHDPRAVKRWLQPLVQELGVQVMVTDDLNLYEGVAKELGIERQVCVFHMLRWVGKAVRELEKSIREWWPQHLWVLGEVKRLVEELPEEGDRLLMQLWQRVNRECGGRPSMQEATPLQRLAGLLIKLCEHWPRYRLYLTEHGKSLGVPATNNLTEQMIGNGKVRSRTVRGYKSRDGLMAAFTLCALRLA